MKLSHTLVLFKYLVWSLKNKIIKYPKLWSCQSLWSQNRGPRNTKGQQLRIGPSEKTKRDTNTKNRLWEEYPHTPLPPTPFPFSTISYRALALPPSPISLAHSPVHWRPPLGIELDLQSTLKFQFGCLPLAFFSKVWRKNKNTKGKITTATTTKKRPRRSTKFWKTPGTKSQNEINSRSAGSYGAEKQRTENWIGPRFPKTEQQQQQQQQLHNWAERGRDSGISLALLLDMIGQIYVYIYIHIFIHV